jgi:hypothetical protein
LKEIGNAIDLQHLLRVTNRLFEKTLITNATLIYCAASRQELSPQMLSFSNLVPQLLTLLASYWPSKASKKAAYSDSP